MARLVDTDAERVLDNEAVAQQLAEEIEDAIAGLSPKDVLEILADLQVRISNIAVDYRDDLLQPVEG